jgi:hypothetical protein
MRRSTSFRGGCRSLEPMRHPAADGNIFFVILPIFRRPGRTAVEPGRQIEARQTEAGTILASVLRVNTRVS